MAEPASAHTTQRSATPHPHSTEAAATSMATPPSVDERDGGPGSPGATARGSRPGAGHGTAAEAVAGAARIGTGQPPVTRRAAADTITTEGACESPERRRGESGATAATRPGREHASSAGSHAAAPGLPTPSQASSPASPSKAALPATGTASASPAGGAHGETLLRCSVDASHRGKVGFFYRQWVCVACKCFFYRHVRDQRNGVPISKQSDPARFAQCLKSGMDPSTVLIRSSSTAASHQHQQHAMTQGNAVVRGGTSRGASVGLLAPGVTGVSAAMTASLHPLLAAAGLRNSVLGGNLRAKGLGISASGLLNRGGPLLTRQGPVPGAAHDARLGHGGIMPSMFHGIGVPRTAGGALVLDARELAASNARYAMALNAQLRQHRHGTTAGTHSDGASPGTGTQPGGFPSPRHAGQGSGHAYGSVASFRQPPAGVGISPSSMAMGAAYGMMGTNGGLAHLQQQMRLAHGTRIAAYQQLLMLRQMQQRRSASFEATAASAAMCADSTAASVPASGSTGGSVRSLATTAAAATRLTTTADRVSTTANGAPRRTTSTVKPEPAVFSPPPAASPARQSEIARAATSGLRAALTVDTVASGACVPVPGASPASLAASFLNTHTAAGHGTFAAPRSSEPAAPYSAPGNLLQLLAAVSSADNNGGTAAKRGKRPRPKHARAAPGASAPPPGSQRVAKRRRACSAADQASLSPLRGVGRSAAKPDSPSSAASVAASA